MIRIRLPIDDSAREAMLAVLPNSPALINPGRNRELLLAKRNRLLEVIEHDVQRLDRLVSDISNASRLDSELVKEEEEEFDLLRTLQNLSQYHGEEAGRKGVDFITDLPPDHWALDPDIGGGRIIGEACHAIDLATYLTGSPPVRVSVTQVPHPMIKIRLNPFKRRSISFSGFFCVMDRIISHSPLFQDHIGGSEWLHGMPPLR